MKRPQCLPFCLCPDICTSQHSSGLDSPLLTQLLLAELIYGRSIVSLLIKDQQAYISGSGSKFLLDFKEAGYFPRC